MTEIKIEKGIPIPLPGSKNSGITYVLRKMDVGDSFITSSPPHTAHQCARQVNIKIAVRKQSEKEFRVWRIK